VDLLKLRCFAGAKVTAARDVAKKLRKFLNDNQLTISDVRRGLVVLLNGKLEIGSPATNKEFDECTT
jgi:hypothetical protein